MKPERWYEASRILENALERDPDRRSAYLDEVCASDDELRREVESLLAASDRSGSLLDSPAMKMAAPLFISNSDRTMLGQSVGRYKIVSALGAGGMGEVYLAHDTRLGRRIALKLLPSHFTTDRDRLRRFEQEAHAASTLSHPNVCVIHEVGESESGYHYIAMELVDGVTLRQHLSGGPLKATEALDVAIQVAAALTAAHAAGIVHRDIKPENIMLRADGFIKVLDFGLAKLTERPRQTIDSDVATRALVQTDVGVRMGTTTYMSPEQARGVTVDARTDIWSLGVVLYEMIAGCQPFEGETPGDLIAAILKTEPQSLTDYVPEAPSELDSLARKVLEKDREARYQTAADLLHDLKEIKQELDFQAKLGRSTQPETRNQSPVETGSDQALTPTADVAAVPTGKETPARTTSSIEYLISEIKQHRARSFTVLGLFLMFSFGLGYLIRRLIVPPKPSPAHFQSFKPVRVTNQGNVGQAAISPDGKYMTYAVNDGGTTSLWTRDLVTDGQTQILPPVAAWLRPNTFTHDGRYIYYLLSDAQNPQGTLYQMPFLGGPSKKILSNIECPISLSPDGKQFSFLRHYEDANEDELLVANTDGRNERALLRPKALWLSQMSAAGWSPDGKLIAVGYGQHDGGDHMLVALVSVADGTLKLMSTPRWFGIGSIVWFSDGAGLVLQMQEREYGRMQIWQMSYPAGEARKVTNDLSSYAGNFTVTADGKTLMSGQPERVSNIWIAQDGETSSAHMIASGKSVQAGLGGLAWTPDGRVVYGNNIEDKKAVWIVNANGSDPKPLTDGTTSDNLPQITADGKYVVVVSTRTQFWDLWRMDIDGNNSKQLTDAQDVGSFCITPDGRWVVYSPVGGDGGGIRKVSIDGGSPIKIIDKPTAGYPQVSPDGKLLACHFGDDATKITVTTFDNGTPVKTVALPGTSYSWFRWSHDSRALIYIDTRQGVSNLWSQPLDGSAPRQITAFKSDKIYQFAVSRDGKQFALARGDGTNDVVMISESK